MISNSFPAASVAITIPGSPGAVANATNVSGPPGMMEVVVPASVTSQVPEMNDTVGARAVAHGPVALNQPSGTSPTMSIRRRPVRNCGTSAKTTSTAPPSARTLAQGSVGVIVSVAVRETVSAVAVRTTLVPTTAGTVVISNVALVAPAATVTLAGTEAEAGALFERLTTNPSAGAARVSVTVPCAGMFADTLAGATEIDDRAGTAGTAVTVSVAVRVTPPNEPLMTTVLVAAGDPAVTLNVAVVAPAATVTLAGTVATAVSALESVTTAPPAGAAALSVAVPTEVPCAPTDVGESESV